jgi:hypothetical protein
MDVAVRIKVGLARLYRARGQSFLRSVPALGVDDDAMQERINPRQMQARVLVCSLAVSGVLRSLISAAA